MINNPATRTRPSSEQPALGQRGGSEDHGHLLLRRMAVGDETALAALYDLWGELVHTLAFCILRDADEAEDVVEETFWQAWRTATRFDDRRAAALTWLVMIARSRALDRLRARRRRADWMAAPSTVSALADQAHRQRTDTPGHHPDRTERYSALATALGTLPPEQRKAVEMAYFDGLSHAEIAEQTGQPVGTVKTRIRLAMDKLRQRLASLHEDL